MVDGNAVAFANNEFQNIELGDERRNWRAKQILYGLIVNVGICISMCCGAMAAQLISRFFKRKEVTLDSILKPHIMETAERIKKYDTVVIAQDTTSLNYNSHKSLEGIGDIGSGNLKGLLMHSALAVSLDRTPLGLVACKVWARKPDKLGKGKECHKYPIEEKESYKWLETLQNVAALAIKETHLVMTGDRENDIYDYLVLPRDINVDFIVRVTHTNRNVKDDEISNLKLKDKIENSPVKGYYDLVVPPKDKMKTRTARMEVKLFDVEIKKPVDRKDKKLPESVRLTCVSAREIDAPAGVETPLCWVLLTSLSLTSLEDAIYAIEIYATRWVIEEFHKVLKSGTKIERLQFETTDSLLPAIGMLSVVAWRLLYLTKYAREKPDHPVDEFADKTEVKILESWAMVKMKRKYRPITTISDFILFVALLGGFMGRKCDGHPGVQVVWKGLRRLEDAVEFHGVFQKLNMITLK